MHTTPSEVVGRTLLARRLSILSASLAFIAAAAGLLIPDLYHETSWAIPQMRGQDAVTLALALALLTLLRSTRHHQPRNQLIWLGLLGYLWYTYVGAAFAYTLNSLLLLYVAIFSSSSAAIIALLLAIDPVRIDRSVDDLVPRRAIRVALLVLATTLALLWLGQIGAFLVTGVAPEGVRRGGNGFIYPYVLDLGVIVPLSVLAASLVKHRNAWGFVIAGAILIKGGAMGLALLGMSLGSLTAGFDVPSELFAAWILIAVGGLGMSSWFFRHVHS